MDQQTKYGAIPEERSKTAQGAPGTKDPAARPAQPQPQSKKKSDES